MTYIKINTQSADSAINDLATLEMNYRNYNETLKEIQNALKRDNAAYVEPVCNKIGDINEIIINNAAKMERLEDALRYTVSAYVEIERKNAGLVSEIPDSVQDTGKNGEEKKSIIQRFWEWLKDFFGWSEKSVDVDKEQEKTQDLAMQSEIFVLLDKDDYKEETWKNATIEERKDILRKYLKEIARIFGITISEDVTFLSLGGSTRGQYSNNGKKISINEDYLSRSDSYQIMYTMIHEMRHAYQYAVVENPGQYNVSKETIKQWADNQKNYKRYDKNVEGSYEEYVSQPIEYDAKNFAKQYTDIQNAKPKYKGSWGQ